MYGRAGGAASDAGLTDYGGYYRVNPDGTTTWVPDRTPPPASSRPSSTSPNGPQRPSWPEATLAPRNVGPPQFAIPAGPVPWPSSRTTAPTLTPIPAPPVTPVYPAVPTPAVTVPATVTTAYALPPTYQPLPEGFVYGPGVSTPIFIPTKAADAEEPQRAMIGGGRSWWWLLLLAAGGYAAWKQYSKERKTKKAE